MQKTSSRINLKKTTQITESHCAPAVLQMLLEHIGISVSQEKITEAARAVKTIKKYGVRVDQMAKAVKKITPEAKLWYKKGATMDDLKCILRKYNYPIGVEWQGVFEMEDENADDDPGHDSVIIDIDDQEKNLIMADPYKDYKEKDRVISTRRFIARWWDINEIIEEKTKKKKKFKDKRMIFIVVPKNLDFPKELGMKKNAEKLYQ